MFLECAVTPMMALFMPLSQAAIIGTSLLAMVSHRLVSQFMHTITNSRINDNNRICWNKEVKKSSKFQ
jgi:hypothetical protein